MAWNKYSAYLIYDDPIPYKDLKIYPATMRVYVEFHYFASVLLLDKNSVPDPSVISMSYLDYLFYANNEENFFIPRLDQLLRLVLRDKDIKIEYGRDNRDGGKAVIKIGETLYDGKDFDEIKNIIVEQNSLELPDENIQKEIRDAMEKAQELKQRSNQTRFASLEDQMVCVLVSTNLKLEDIYDLSIRKFSKILQRADVKLHYQIYMTAALGGFADIKDKSVLKHWMSDLEKNPEEKYNDLLFDMDRVKDKLDFQDKIAKNS